jgi:uncharacterized protein YegL
VRKTALSAHGTAPAGAAVRQTAIFAHGRTISTPENQMRYFRPRMWGRQRFRPSFLKFVKGFTANSSKDSEEFFTFAFVFGTKEVFQE